VVAIKALIEGLGAIAGNRSDDFSEGCQAPTRDRNAWGSGTRELASASPTLVRMWQVTRSQIAYENPWIRVVEDQVIHPDGTQGMYGVVELRQPAVFVVAVSDRGEVLLETVERHTVGPSIEIPAGGSDGEDLLAAAKRELYEETGYLAEHWRSIGSMNALNGVCRAAEHVFLAQGLSRSADGADATAEGISAGLLGGLARPSGHDRGRQRSQTARPWLL